MLYHPPSGSTDANAPYVGKNVAAGTQGSKVPPLAIEYTQREIVNAITSAGLAPSDGDLFQLWKAIQSGSKSALTTKAIVGGRVLFDQIAAGTYTWICPADTTIVRIRAVAGGGGAGGGNAYSGAGGTGANYFEGVFDVVPGTTYTIVIGAGGAGGGGGGGGAPGGNGGSTYIAVQGGAALAVAVGGAGSESGGVSAGNVGKASPPPALSGITFPHGGFEVQGYPAQDGIFIPNVIMIGGMGGGSRLAPNTVFGVGYGSAQQTGFPGLRNGGGGSGGTGAALGGMGAPGALFIEG